MKTDKALVKIFKDDSLEKDAVIQNFRITADDEKAYKTTHGDLDVIISARQALSTMGNQAIKIAL